MRKQLHYEWHWFWPTGNGEMGNNGIHVNDLCRWGLGQNQPPPRALSIGGRFAFNERYEIRFGIDNVAWLATTDPPWYWLVIVTLRLWLQIGFYMILFLAGLQRISPELYEAAKVDGAKVGWQTFRYITFPQLRATSVAVLLLLLINAYQAFDEFFNLLGNSSFARPPLVYLYYTAQGNQDYGHGSAGAVILAVLIMIVTLAQGRIFGFGKAAE